MFTSATFIQAKNFDFDQVLQGEVQQKANIQSMNEFKIREYQDANVQVTKINRGIAYDVLNTMAGQWIHIKPNIHYGVKADFTIKPGQKISYYVKLVDWYEGCSSPSFGVSSKVVAPNANICGEYPVGISYLWANGNYATRGSYKI